MQLSITLLLTAFVAIASAQPRRVRMINVDPMYVPAMTTSQIEYFTSTAYETQTLASTSAAASPTTGAADPRMHILPFFGNDTTVKSANKNDAALCCNCNDKNESSSSSTKMQYAIPTTTTTRTTVTKTAHTTVVVRRPGVTVEVRGGKGASATATGSSTSSSVGKPASSSTSSISSASEPASTSSTSATAAPTSGMSADQNETLAMQNAARADVGVAPMQWDSSLVAVAKGWAATLRSQNCAFYHSGNNKYGENIAMGTSNMAGAIKLFLNEKSDYNGMPIDSNNYSHYTQIVWRKTTHVGCYYESACRLTVCNYSPPGNYMGSMPY